MKVIKVRMHSRMVFEGWITNSSIRNSGRRVQKATKEK